MALSESALTLVTAVETELGITAGSDTRIEGWITDVSEIIAQYLGRVLYRRGAITEKYPGNAHPWLVLDAPPINTLTSISFDGVALAATDYEIHDSEAGAVYFIGQPTKWTAYIGEGVSRDPVPGTERNLYTVIYDGGWITPRQNETGTYAAQAVTLPRAIQRAAIQAVIDIRARVGQGGDIASESLLSYSVTYKDTAGDDSGYGLSEFVRALLKPYVFEE